MMRLWKTSYARPVSMSKAGFASVAAHAVIVAAWVGATMPGASLPADSLANRVYYIPPVNKPPPPMASHEVVHYLTLTPGIGIGPGPADLDARRPITSLVTSARSGGERVDTASTPTPPPVVTAPTEDSVFTELDVDSVVVRSQNSAGPAYPLELLEKHIEGMVVARYVVDTTGFADTASFEVMSATHPDFIRAVRDALPYMRFSPAKIGAHKVRQLVEQPFTFRIADGPTKPVP
jgi:TonB family protein